MDKPPIELFHQLLLDFDSQPESFVNQKNIKRFIVDRYFAEKCSIMGDIDLLVQSDKNLKAEITKKAFNYREREPSGRCFCLTEWIYCGPMVVNWMMNNIVKGSTFDMCMKVINVSIAFNDNKVEEYGPNIVLRTLLSRKKYDNSRISYLLLRVTNGNKCLISTLFEHITEFRKEVWSKMIRDGLCTKRKTHRFIEQVPLGVCRDVLGSGQCRLESFWFVLSYFRGVCEEKGLARSLCNILLLC